MNAVLQAEAGVVRRAFRRLDIEFGPCQGCGTGSFEIVALGRAAGGFCNSEEWCAYYCRVGTAKEGMGIRNRRFAAAASASRELALGLQRSHRQDDGKQDLADFSCRSA